MDNNLTIKNNAKSRRGFLQGITKWIGGTAILAATANLITFKESKASTLPLAGTSDYLGSIEMVAFTFAPNGWALCNGQLLPISGNDALFSIIGTIYSGDGRTNFGLPDFRGRFPIHVGNGHTLGQNGGEEAHTLTLAEMPAHNHTLAVNSGGGTSDNPTNNYIASNSEGMKHYSSSAGSNSNVGSIGNSGSGNAHNNMPPYLCVNFIIALIGIYPT